MNTLTAAPPAAECGTPPIKSRALISLRARPMVALSLLWIVFLVALAAVRPLLPLPDPARSDYQNVAVPPGFSGAHLLGTDEIGRDILARLITGGQVSLLVGIGAVAIAVLAGAPLGILAGYFRGWVAPVIGTVIDIQLAFPALVALIALVVFLGPGLITIVVGIGIVSAPAVARVSRAATKTYAEREFVVAAQGMGAGSWRIIRREVLPNVIVPVLAYSMVLLAVAIVAEGSLSFLGLGVPPPSSSWGSMMGSGRSELNSKPHIVLLPALAMMLTLLALNFLAEQFGRRFDIRESAL
ncbi:ABC transporter permease [Streptomyces sp. NPDC058221]|uniref:ABC transporter permease n=1 Tax=Streptomyces sp. NPDC058221 TaxID=3346388 RepID=UPI0036EDDCAD